MNDSSAVVVGSGPNGLAAAVMLARAGCAVRVYEAESTIGGGTRSAALTLPGFVHDVCSAVHPLALASPCFAQLPLDQHGLSWVHPEHALAHPFDDGSAAVLDRSLEITAESLGVDDGRSWRRTFEPMLRHRDAYRDALLAPLLPPRHPWLMAGFGLQATRSAAGFARARFSGERARGLFAGLAAHSFLSLDAPVSASFGLTLGWMAHAWGWPFARGGSQRIADALIGYLQTLGGAVEVHRRITAATQLDDASLVMFDIMPRQLAAIGADRLPAGYRRRLERYRHGPGAFKVDWALREPIPWRASACRKAGTVHVGATLDEVARSERDVTHGRHSERPFVLLAQPTVCDPTRAPAGRHVAWAYCHVPNESSFDMTARIEAQVERFAPGFRDIILERHVSTPADIEHHNANLIGGDIVGGANDLWQLIARPMLSLNPYRIPVPGWFLCSSATPPGGGVHGMAGYHAARSALRSLQAK